MHRYISVPMNDELVSIKETIQQNELELKRICDMVDAEQHLQQELVRRWQESERILQKARIKTVVIRRSAALIRRSGNVKIAKPEDAVRCQLYCEKQLADQIKRRKMQLERGLVLRSELQALRHELKRL